MDKDFDIIEARRKAVVLEEEHRDLTDERAGRETFRHDRLNLPNNPKILAEKRKRDRRTMEMVLLAQACLAAYNDAMKTLGETETLAYEAYARYEAEFNTATLAHETLLDKAPVSSEGLRVFRDDDGTVFDEEGHRLGADEAALIGWSADAPSWKEYQRSRKELKEAQERFESVQLSINRLGEIRDELDELKDQGDQAALDKIKGLHGEIESIRDNFSKEIESTLTATNTQNITVPELGL